MSDSMVHTIAKPLIAKNSVLTDIFLAIIGSLFVGAMSQVSIPLPFSPIPITGQTFAVLLIALTYGNSLTFNTLLLYLAEGISGLPVFAGGTSGIGVILGPTGGYLIGFVFGGLLIATMVKAGFGKKPLHVFLISLAGNVVIYIFGILGLMRFMDFSQTLTLGVYPFIFGDIIKAILVGLAVPTAWKAIQKIRG